MCLRVFLNPTHIKPILLVAGFNNIGHLLILLGDMRTILLCVYYAYCIVYYYIGENDTYAGFLRGRKKCGF